MTLIPDGFDGLAFERDHGVACWSENGYLVTSAPVERLAEKVADNAERYGYERTRRARHEAFMAEADPLFFGWQRGENTKQAWLDKCEEIRQRFPYAAP